MRIDRQHRLWKAHAREVKRFKRRVPAEQARVEWQNWRDACEFFARDLGFDVRVSPLPSGFH